MTLIQRLKDRLEEKRVAKVVLPHTLAGPQRVQNLYRLAKRVEKEGVPGDIVECGVYNGGTAAVLARVATHSNLGRTIWLFDSFQGMPETTEVDGDDARRYVGEVRGSADQVRDLLHRAGADLARVRIVEGLFQETFPTVQIPKIALLNIDADWYESVKLCLEMFYDCVAPKGFVCLDDYGHWPGCRRAVDEFFEKRGLSYPLQVVDYTARWFQKL
jgi:O-methyltransferase